MQIDPGYPVRFYSCRRKRTDQELKELYLGIREGRIFCDRHVHPDEVLDLLPLIFMPLALGGARIIRQMKLSKAEFLYMDMSEASPRAINGYPCFFSMKMLNTADTKRLWEIKDRVEAALSGV